MKRLGVVGTMVWDTIYGRDTRDTPVEEWGGIAYALAALAARLPDEWRIVPLIKVGRDLAASAGRFLRSLPRVAPGTRFVEVPDPNNRVTLQYESEGRRSEQLTGGVPPWTWPELGPMIADLDALYVNFISGFEMTLETARAVRQAFPRFLYADLHSLFLTLDRDGWRELRALPDAVEWFACFDAVHLNEDELLAALAAHRGTRYLTVTVGPRGAIYVEAPPNGGPMRTALVAAPAVNEGDPTGCGDVFGATVVCELLTGHGIEDAVALANRLAARNVSYRGATGLHRHLRGELLRA
jgi:sugar/nucleoside kinase (ribokinase family)